MKFGSAEAEVLLKKVSSFGDPRLYAVSIVADALSHSEQPLVPETVLGGGGSGMDGQGGGMLGVLMSLMVADRLGKQVLPATTYNQPPVEKDGNGKK